MQWVLRVLCSGASVDKLSWCAVWKANLFSSTPVCDMLLCVNTFVSKFMDVNKMTFVRACAGHAADTEICLPLTTPSSQEGKGD